MNIMAAPSLIQICCQTTASRSTVSNGRREVDPMGRNFSSAVTSIAKHLRLHGRNGRERGRMPFRETAIPCSHINCTEAHYGGRARVRG
jgi:hypothetical protein